MSATLYGLWAVDSALGFGIEVLFRICEQRARDDDHGDAARPTFFFILNTFSSTWTSLQYFTFIHKGLV